MLEYPVIPKFFNKTVPVIVLPEQYKEALKRANDLAKMNPENGSEEEMEIIMLIDRISQYEKSLYNVINGSIVYQ